MYNGKIWYESKTVWMNGVAGLLLVVLPMVGIDPAPEIVSEYSVHLLVVINLVLRFVTDKPVDW